MPTINIPLSCFSCGGVLTGVDAEALCPGCGAPVSASLGVHGLGADLVVCEDVGCAFCRYNLRMQPATGCCPECGKAVAGSLRPDDLRGADRDWLRRVRSGVTLLLVLPLAVVLLGCLLSAAPSQPLARWGPTWAGVLIWLGMGALLYVGMFRASSRDTSPTAGAYPTYPYALTRWALIAGLTIAVLQWVVSAFAFGMPGRMASGGGIFFSRVFVYSMLVGMVSMVAVTVALAGLALCIRNLFARARQVGSRKLATVLAWFTAVGGLTLLIGSVGVVFQMRTVMQAMAAGPVAASMPAGAFGLSGAAGVSAAPGVSVEDYSSPATPAATMPSRPKLATGQTLPLATRPSGLPGGVTPGGPVPPITLSPLFWLMQLANCVGSLVVVASGIMMLIVLLRARKLLTRVLAVGSA